MHVRQIVRQENVMSRDDDGQSRIAEILSAMLFDNRSSTTLDSGGAFTEDECVAFHVRVGFSTIPCAWLARDLSVS